MNPLKKLGELGQAPWLDHIHRELITGGKLKSLIEDDGLRGMTSNPKIFEKAITGGDAYEEEINELASSTDDVKRIYEQLSMHDVGMAADVFRPLYDRTNGLHGFVSLEVNPHLAHDTQATIEEARRLWKSLERPNVLIKVPGTREGLPAISQLISEGVNVNVTLLFGLPRYRKVAEAYMQGVEKRLQAGQPVDHVRSVASFFLSRIDVLVDPMLEKLVEQGGEKAETARSLHGQVAIASAKSAYKIYREITAGERWKKLAEQQARPQWLLWASTSTKNPDYSDVKYIEPLIGPETVNTMPMETLEAYRDHGEPQPRLEGGIDEASRKLEQLAPLGIDIDEVTQQLEDEGVEKFNRPFDQLLESIGKELSAAKQAH